MKNASFDAARGAGGRAARRAIRIQNRDPAAPPENWATTAQPDAVRAMRKATADMVCARAVERGGEASPARIEALPGGGAV